MSLLLNLNSHAAASAANLSRVYYVLHASLSSSSLCEMILRVILRGFDLS